MRRSKLCGYLLLLCSIGISNSQEIKAYVSKDGDSVWEGDSLLPKSQTPIRVIYLPSTVDGGYSKSLDWLQHFWPKAVDLDAYSTEKYKSYTEDIALDFGLKCSFIAGDGLDFTAILPQISKESNCVILEPTRIYETERGLYSQAICRRLQTYVIVARNPCADIEINNTRTGYKSTLHVSSKFNLIKMSDKIDSIMY